VSLTDQVVDGVKRMILTGELRPGDRLPVEKDLAAALGVSRGSLREGVRALAVLGVLDVRQGAGTYVTSLDPRVLFHPVGFAVDLQEDELARPFHEVRRVLEVEAAALAARYIDDGGIAACEAALAQAAALGAFEESSYAEADGHVERYAVNRGLLLDGLPRLGITRLAPADGAFYVYADVAHLTADSMDLTYRLLADTGVAVAPGLDFDPVDGHRTIRLSCAGSEADVREALRRLEDWLA